MNMYTNTSIYIYEYICMYVYAFSDELKDIIEQLRGHDDKIRIVLNKSDQVFMRVNVCVSVWVCLCV